MDERLHNAFSMLPELYQPLYGMEMDNARIPSRSCADRLAEVVKVVSAHPSGAPRVIDVGCAQGYMSLGIADKVSGSSVYGIDYLPENIDVCKLLAQRNSINNAKFSCELVNLASFEEWLKDGYQVVLFLNVLHHVCTQFGWEETKKFLDLAATKVDFIMIELASSKERLEWTRNLPSDEDWLSGFRFVLKLGEFATHVSNEKRALYFCSNRYALIEGQAFEFFNYMERSHAGAFGADILGRRYYLSPTLVVKKFDFYGKFGRKNKVEFLREVRYLSRVGSPKLLATEIKKEVGLVARECIAGLLLVDFWKGGDDTEVHKIFGKILARLIDLEQQGLYHHDLRPWNILVTPNGDVELIDFGSIRSRKMRLCFEDALSLLAWMYTLRWEEGIAAEHGVAYAAHFPLFEYLHRTSSERLSFVGMRGVITSKDHRHSPPEFLSCHHDDLRSSCRRVQKVGRQIAALTEWATSADAYAKSLLEELTRMREAYEAERSARTAVETEAQKQIDGLTEWATSADAYAKSLLEEQTRMREAYEAERSARATVEAEAQKRIAALTEWATSADAYAKSLLEELTRIREAYEAERRAREAEQAEARKQIAALGLALSAYKSHWIFKIFKHPNQRRE